MEKQAFEHEYDPQQVTHYLQTLGNPVVEVRIFRKDRYMNRQWTGDVVAGYYDNEHFEKLSADIQPYVLDLNTEAIYTTIQKLHPDTLYRISNRLKSGVKDKELTSDLHVAGFLLFPIDVDPPRLTGISSSDDELNATKAKSRQIADALDEIGIPTLHAMSGNGCHINTLLELLDNTEENAKKFKALGNRVAEHFDTDTTIYNPSRIFKLYGTYARKGDDTPERPHRQAWIHIENPRRITFDDLESKLNTILPPIDAPTNERQTNQVSESSGYQNKQNAHQQSRTLKEWLDDYGIRYTEKSYKDGTKYQMDCPFDPTHTSPDAACYEAPGGWAFKCSHNSCASYKWAAFKAKVAPQAPNGSQKSKNSPSSESKDNSKTKSKRVNPLPELRDASQYFIHDDFNVLAMSRHIQDKFIVWAQDSGIYLYDGMLGIYRPGENTIDAAIRTELGELRKARYIDEVLKDLNATCRREVPDTSHLIAFQNGVLDLKTDDESLCDFSEHSPENYLMSFFPSHFSTEFIETEGSKDFDAWLLDILDGDTGLHKVIFEVIGSIFHQRSTDMQRGILMVGEGGTGKSMLIEQIERMVGRENISGRAWSDYGYDSFAFGDLYSKALALDSDIDVSRPLSGAIKPAVTGNTLVCNQKYQQPFNFNPFATWIGSINKFPRTRDSTWGFFRRWIAIPFNKTFPTNSVFESKKRKLWSDPDTISSIIHKAVGLYRTAYLNGTYTIPDAAAELSRAMYQAANSVISWLDQFTTPDPDTSMTRAEAYQSYAEYCIASGFEPENTRNFYATLRSQGYDPDRKKQLDGKNVRVVNGLHLS